ncbi:MAG: acyl-ACP--UDP-N-acetylglucosamine O-acyltransferase [Verrucomicrobia bacterium]|nr:acyl-ACP--UDP-N-acetylglucosamine O-acyltransferase [Verrucomicrobiota bacterium]
MIHPTAIIHPTAQLDPSAEVGPFCVIDAHVIVGPNCRLGPYVHLTGHTILGAGNRLHAGCVLGDAPQDLKYGDAPTRLRIGDHNIFREQVTIHRSNQVEEDTVIGSHCFFMAHSHVGHNARVGNHAIIANGVAVAGHAIVEDRAFISGNCLVHQFCRVGTLALMQGGSAISKDLPPYTIARGDNGMCGLNVVGLRRAGFTNEQRLELKRLYHLLFRSGLPLKKAIARARPEFPGTAAAVLLDFLATSKRGIVTDTGRRGTANRVDAADSE